MRGTQRYAPILRSDEDALTRAIITLASQYGRYGYRRITVLLRQEILRAQLLFPAPGRESPRHALCNPSKICATQGLVSSLHSL